MKNVLYKIGVGLCAVLCVCLLSTTTALAVEDTDTPTYCVGALEIGQTAKYICFNKMNSGKYDKIVMEHNVTTDDMYMCFYLVESTFSTSGYSLNPIDTVGAMRYQYDENMTEFSSYGGNNVTNVVPIEYSNTVASNHPIQTIQFETNIPIFPTLALAKQYNSGDVSVLPQAINYKLSWNNGSWVKPFEDIEINDSDMPSPVLSDITHTGFNITNTPGENYMVDIYLESGIQQPNQYYFGTVSIENSLYTNSFGLISDIEAAYTGGQIDILKMYNVDNYTALNESKNSFYSEYPSCSVYGKAFPSGMTSAVNKINYSLWGAPTGKNYIFYSLTSAVSQAQAETLDVNDFPLAYTNYRVRFYYYDEESGFHYGPWSNYIYYSDGRVKHNEIFQGNNGDIIETPIIEGTQSSSGNISYEDNINYIDLNNPNSLFGYIRSVANNIDATMGNFSTLFATVFTFIPADIQAMI